MGVGRWGGFAHVPTSSATPSPEGNRLFISAFYFPLSAFCFCSPLSAFRISTFYFSSVFQHPLYVFRGHGRRAGWRFQKCVIALTYEAGLLGLRSRRTEARGEKAYQFLFLFRRQGLRGGFNLEQCAHAESLAPTVCRGKVISTHHQLIMVDSRWEL